MLGGLHAMMLGGAAALSAAFAPALGAGAVYSNGNRTVGYDNASGAPYARSQAARSSGSGKYSFRFVTTGAFIVGLSGYAANAANVWTDTVPGQSTGGGGLSVSSGGGVNVNAVAATSIPATSGAAVVDILLDTDNRRAWIVVNGTLYPSGSNPATPATGYNLGVNGDNYWAPGCNPAYNGVTVTLDTSVSRYAGFAAWGLGDHEFIQSLPFMTSNTAPSGYTALAKSEYDSRYIAANAFDGGSADWANAGNVTTWCQRGFPAPVKIGALIINHREAAGATLRFLGSNDGTSFTDLGTGVATQQGYPTKYLIAAAKRAKYSYFRVQIENAGGPNPGMIECTMLQSP
ncbi:discoidin domain-containing protein [Methylobacterium sp. A54F]